MPEAHAAYLETMSATTWIRRLLLRHRRYAVVVATLAFAVSSLNYTIVLLHHGSAISERINDSSSFASEFAAVLGSSSSSSSSQQDESFGTVAWRSPLADDPPSARGTVPTPVQIMELYREQHSVQALESEMSANIGNGKPSPTTRTYAVAFYSCPHSAGNRLHEFLNYAMWSVVTNRTLLWKYFDRPTCVKWAPKLGISLLHCEGANDVTDCDAILNRAPWMASYDEYSHKLKLSEPKVLPPKSTDKQTVWYVDKDAIQHQVVVFPHSTISENILGSAFVRSKKLHSRRNQRVAEGLFRYGTDFLFGMLQRYSFEFSKSILDSVQAPRGLLASSSSSASKSYSIAVHSRHNDQKETGCNVTQETQCLQRMLEKQPNGTQCHVAVMADRECTLSELQKWLSQRACRIHVAEHQQGKGTYAEHGPFAGAGYFQDLALASSITRDGVVGSWLHDTRWRSSSLLLLELVEFYRRMDAWRRHYSSSSINVGIGGDENTTTKSIKIKMRKIQKCTLGDEKAMAAARRGRYVSTARRHG